MRRKKSEFLIPDARGRIQLPEAFRKVELFAWELIEGRLSLTPLQATPLKAIEAQNAIHNEFQKLINELTKRWIKQNPAVEAVDILSLDPSQKLCDFKIRYKRPLLEREQNLLNMQLQILVEDIWS